jgi:cytochrome c oxidase subunit III
MRNPAAPPRIQRPTIDVAALPPGAFGYRAVMWWGTMGICLIEGTVFALAIAAYFFYADRTPYWPPHGDPVPALLWGSVNTVVLLVSGVPNELAKRAAERIDLSRTRLWLVVCLLFGVGFNVLRALEFMSLGVRWDRDAYGSIVWLLLGLHTTHIVTDFLDTLVLTVLMFTGPIEERRFVDVAENSAYWYFVVGVWVPIYGVIYWAPRVL